MDELIDGAFEFGGRLAVGLLILLAGTLLALLTRRLVRRLLGRPRIADTLGPSMVRLLSSAAYYLLLGVAVGIVLIALGLPGNYVIAIFVVLIALLALALRQSLANFAATVSFLLFQPFRRGELIETMGHMGTVQEILLLTTVLVLPDHRIVSLPNSKIHEDGIVNYSRQGRIWTPFTLTVPYSENIDRVRALIIEVAASDQRILPEPPFEVAVDELGEHGVRLPIMPTVAPDHYWQVRSELQANVKARFDQEGIRFAAPPRDIHLMPARTQTHHDDVTQMDSASAGNSRDRLAEIQPSRSSLQRQRSGERDSKGGTT